MPDFTVRLADRVRAKLIETPDTTAEVQLLKLILECQFETLHYLTHFMLERENGLNRRHT